MAKQSQPALDDAVLYQWGNEKLTSDHQKKFVKHFIAAPGKVLEIGCGYGVTLGLMKNAGIAAYGIDLSANAVAICHQKELEAYDSDALSHLKNVPAASLGGIFCAHVIEHLEPAGALELIAESHRVLKPGGKIVFITPNAKDLRTTERFWLDLTHVRLYPEKLMKFLLTKQGFARVETFTDTEPGKNLPEKFVKKLLRLWFMGYIFTGDLVVVAQR